MTADRCEIQAIHPELLDQARQGMPLRQNLRDMADLFKVLADDTRMQLICALLHHELCVCDLAETACDEPVSHFSSAQGPQTGPTGPFSPGREKTHSIRLMISILKI